MSAISDLISEYNAVEEAQRTRLEQLYDLLNARRNFRYVKFGEGSPWSNCWNIGRPAAEAHNIFVDPHIHIITQAADEGDDPA